MSVEMSVEPVNPYAYTPFHPPGYLQLSHQTQADRFPKIFASAKELCPNPKRILSFGCSTGEECFSLAQLYPDSEIVGIDIDYYTIQTARRNNKYKNINFLDQLGATGKYDLAFCLMVLFAIDQPVQEEQFGKTLKLIDEHLNNDAVLMVYTAEYDPNLVLNYHPIKQWKRVHNKNNKEYFNGYYRKVINEDLTFWI